MLTFHSIFIKIFILADYTYSIYASETNHIARVKCEETEREREKCGFAYENECQLDFHKFIHEFGNSNILVCAWDWEKEREEEERLLCDSWMNLIQALVINFIDQYPLWH